MNDWKKQLEDRAERTAILYAMDDARQGRKGQDSRKDSGKSFDTIYGFFAIFMAVALGMIAFAFSAISSEAYAREGAFTAAFYVVLCLIMLVSGICSAVRGSR